MCSRYMGGAPHKGLGLLPTLDLLSQQLSSDMLVKTSVSPLMALFVLFELFFLFVCFFLIYTFANSESLLFFIILVCRFCCFVAKWCI